MMLQERREDRSVSLAMVSVPASVDVLTQTTQSKPWHATFVQIGRGGVESYLRVRSRI